MVSDTTTARAKPSIGDYLKKNIREYGLLVALVVIMLFFQVLTGGVLFKPVNLTNLVLQNSFIVIMALGMLLIIVAGHIDLSVGSIVALVGGLAAIMLVKWGIHYAIVIPLCLILGGLIGAAQGYWIAYQKIPAFIVTLAGMLVFRGLTYLVLQNRPIGPFPKDFQILSTGFLPDFLWFLSSDPATSGTAPMEVYTELLDRVGRSAQAIDIALRQVPDDVPSPRMVPPLLEMAGRCGHFAPILQYCIRKNDLLGYAATAAAENKWKKAKSN